MESVTLALDERFASLFPRLLRFGLLHLDLAAAEDAASLALQRLWLADPDCEFDLESSVQTAFSAMRGAVSNELRARRRRSALFERIASLYSSGSDVIPDVMDRIDAGLPEEMSRLLDELGLLEKHTLALVIDGFTVSEIAGLLELTPSSVSSALYRARTKLRTALSASLRGEHS